jgi:uncharacterized membrane protein YeiB
MTMPAITCVLCNHGRMTRKVVRSHAPIVVRGGRLTILAAVVLFVVGICSALALHTFSVQMILLVAATLGISLMMGLVGLLATESRVVNWCQECHAVVGTWHEDTRLAVVGDGRLPVRVPSSTSPGP